MAFNQPLEMLCSSSETSQQQTQDLRPSEDEENRRNLKMLLGVLKNEICTEKLPPAIDSLRSAYESLGQQGLVILPKPITDNIILLQSRVNDKLVKLRDRSILGNIGQCIPQAARGYVGNIFHRVVAKLSPSASEGVPHRTRDVAWQQDTTAREEFVAQVFASAVTQPSQSHYELESGERLSEVVRLSRSVSFTLTSEVTRFFDVARAADSLDRVCHSAFGFSLYSDDFSHLCSLMADSSQNASLGFENFLLRIQDPRRAEFMKKMSSDHNLRNQLKQLKESVLDKDPLFRIIALCFVNEIMSVVPVDSERSSTELVLESLQMACEIFLLTQLSSIPPSSKKIREGIEKLMSKVYLLKMCNP